MKSVHERTKVVVRQLPPNLTEDAFKVALDSVVAGKYNWFVFFPGKTSNAKTVHSRAYINFELPEHLYEFSGHFNGHIFVNATGKQFKCAVEYAPFQKVPQATGRPNPFEGTIDKDPDYCTFLQQVESNTLLSNMSQTTTHNATWSKPSSDVKITPLMEFLAQKYSNTSLRKGSGRRAREQARQEAQKELDQKMKAELQAKEVAAQAIAARGAKGLTSKGAGVAASAKTATELTTKSGTRILSLEAPKKNSSKLSTSVASISDQKQSNTRIERPLQDIKGKQVVANALAGLSLREPSPAERQRPQIQGSVSSQGTEQQKLSELGKSTSENPTEALPVDSNAPVKPARKVRAGFQAYVPKAGQRNAP